jgi:hypothetical protein
MTGPRDELHDALLELESSAPFESPPPLQDRANRRRLWLAAGGVAVAAALAGVVIGNAVSNPTSEPRGVVTSPSPSAAPATPSPSPTPSPTAAPIETPASTASPTAAEPASGWRVVPFESSDPESVGRITFDDRLGVWMIVELHRDLDGGLKPIPVRTSANGTDWEVTGSIPLDGVDPTGFLQIGRVVRFGGELYISATHTDGSNASSALAWTSMDGSQWDRSPTEMPVGEYGQAEVIASTGRRLLAEVGERDGGHLWTSADGRSWTEADVPSQGQPMGVDAVHADADGFVLAGSVLQDGSTWVPAIWTSADGSAWTRASSLPVGGGHALGVTRAPDGSYIAAIELDDAPTQLVSSPDGLTWSTVLEIGKADERPSGLDASPSGAIYIGKHGAAVRVLSWLDGAWRELTPPADSSTEYGYSDLSVGSAGWVAAGTQGGTDQPGGEILPPILLVGDFKD